VGFCSIGVLIAWFGQEKKALAGAATLNAC
jgi:hypothetical protein